MDFLCISYRATSQHVRISTLCWSRPPFLRCILLSLARTVQAHHHQPKVLTRVLLLPAHSVCQGSRMRLCSKLHVGGDTQIRLSDYVQCVIVRWWPIRRMLPSQVGRCGVGRCIISHHVIFSFRQTTVDLSLKNILNTCIWAIYCKINTEKNTMLFREKYTYV